MDKFVFSDRYRLELHWEKAVYEKEGVCNLNGAYFSGPALSEAARINDNDHLLLDFFDQYMVLVDNVYVAKFSWEQVEYVDSGKVCLLNTSITHASELNKVPKFKDNDYLIIDTSNHTTELHTYNLLYKTYVVNSDTNLYKFGK